MSLIWVRNMYIFLILLDLLILRNAKKIALSISFRVGKINVLNFRSLSLQIYS